MCRLEMGNSSSLFTLKWQDKNCHCAHLHNLNIQYLQHIVCTVERKCIRIITENVQPQAGTINVQLLFSKQSKRQVCTKILNKNPCYCYIKFQRMNYKGKRYVHKHTNSYMVYYSIHIKAGGKYPPDPTRLKMGTQPPQKGCTTLGQNQRKGQRSRPQIQPNVNVIQANRFIGMKGHRQTTAVQGLAMSRRRNSHVYTEVRQTS